MLPTDSKKSTTLGVQPLPTSSPKKIWHWLRRRQILQEGVWQPNNMGAAALNAVLTSCWMHSPALPSLGMLPPYRIPVHGDEVPQVRPRAFPVQDWNLCWGGGGWKSLKSWTQAIGINWSWAATYKWPSLLGLPASLGGKNPASYSGLYHVFSLWPGPFSLPRGDPYSWHSFFLSYLMRF